MANLLGRSANSITLRLVNFASCDPYHQQRGVKGMTSGKKLCQPIWDEFVNNRESLFFESERILAEKQNQTIETKYNDLLIGIGEMKGETKIREVKTRVNQNVFRQIVLSNYDKKCALTGIDIPELLVASHIIPWANNEKERLNPENGICLSALYDKAFDKGLIGFTPQYKVIISDHLKKNENKEYYCRHFSPLEKQSLKQPQKFLPNPQFLEWHLNEVFLG